MDRELIERLVKESGFTCWSEWPEYRENWEHFAQLVAEACAKNAALFSINKQQIHPDIPFEAMSEDAQRVCHATCQSIAVAIRERFGVKP